MIPGGPGQIRGGVEAFFGLGDAQRPPPGDPDLPLLPTCSRCPMSLAAPTAVLANGGTDPYSCPVPLSLCHTSSLSHTHDGIAYWFCSEITGGGKSTQSPVPPW